jgi:hypothetical protein
MENTQLTHNRGILPVSLKNHKKINDRGVTFFFEWSGFPSTAP